MTKVVRKGKLPEFEPVTIEVTIEDMDTFCALKNVYDIADLGQAMEDYDKQEQVVALDRFVQEIGSALS